MSRHDIYNCLTPTCPHCGYAMDADDMNAHEEDLWALAPDEGRAEIICPNILCKEPYFVQGGYRPHYTSAIDEDDL